MVVEFNRQRGGGGRDAGIQQKNVPLRRLQGIDSLHTGCYVIKQGGDANELEVRDAVPRAGLN